MYRLRDSGAKVNRFQLTSLTLAGAPSNPLTAGGALVTMARFAAMETKPAMNAGAYGPAAMFHDYENAQRPFWRWAKHA